MNGVTAVIFTQHSMVGLCRRRWTRRRFYRTMGTIFRPALFREPDFRRLGASVLFNSIGMMGETVVLGWLALELTNSPLLVGVAMSMRMLPLFFVGVPAGAVADRFPRNQLLMLTGAGQALTASTLGTLAW